MTRDNEPRRFDAVEEGSLFDRVWPCEHPNKHPAGLIPAYHRGIKLRADNHAARINAMREEWDAIFDARMRGE